MVCINNEELEGTILHKGLCYITVQVPEAGTCLA